MVFNEKSEIIIPGSLKQITQQHNSKAKILYGYFMQEKIKSIFPIALSFIII